MKVRKEQFLLPKGETIAKNTQWIQSHGKPFDLSKAIKSITSQQLIEGLPSALVTKVKPSLVISNGDLILSGSGPIYWQQQNGLLRQALLNTEKHIQNQNESGVIPNGGVLSIKTITPQQLTPLPSSQVVKVSDCQVILGDSLPLSWQNDAKKTVPGQTISLIENGDSQNIGNSFVISDQRLAVGPLSNISVLSKNQISTIFIKDAMHSSSADLSPSNNLIKVVPISSNKLSTSKSIVKTAKLRKKANQAKKIKIKPASSLLSKSALDYTNLGNATTYNKPGQAIGFNKLHTTSGFEPQENDKVGIECTTTVRIEPIDLVTNVTSSTISEMSPQPTIHPIISNIPLTTNAIYSSSSISNVKTTHSFENLTTLRVSTEPNIEFNSSEVNLIESTVDESGILVTSNSSLMNNEEPLIIDGTVVVHETVVDTEVSSNSSEKFSRVESLPVSHQRVALYNGDSQHPDNGISVFDKNDQSQTILSSDIEHEGHHTPEYTDNILSQLSRSRVLPNMSSSQVSSVLNALGSTDKFSQNNLPTNLKSIKQSVKCEPTDFVKIEALNVQNVSRFLNKESETKYHVYELNNHTCFRCSKCMYMSLTTESIDSHWAEEHQQSDKNCTKRSITCLGCPNVVYSKYALQVHLICDHNVRTTEVHDLIAATFSANRSHRDLKKLPPSKHTNHQKIQDPSPQRENEQINVVPDILPQETYESNIASVITQCLSTVSTEEQIIEASNDLPHSDEKDDEQKLSSVEIHELPATPSFCLFSEVQNPSENEGSFTLNRCDLSPISCKNKLSLERIGLKSPLRYKTLRKKLKPELYHDVKPIHKCTVDRCGVRLSSVVNLRYHQRCHKLGSDLLVCPECGHGAINWTSMTTHLWRRHQIDIDLFSCKVCNYKTSSYSKLVNGHVKIHGEERPFICDICEKGFKTKKQMRNHKLIHRGRKRNGFYNTGESDGVDNINDNGYTCHTCSRSFADSRILKHHTLNVHKGARPYFCSFCAHTASSKSSLRMHIRQHTGEKPFGCDECDYITSDHNSLRRHKMRHTGQRPYQCPHCPYNCIQATTYKSHLKNKHPGLDEGLMFSCPSCPFRTVKRDNYLSHKAQHDLGGQPRGKRRHTHQPPELLQSNLSPSSYLLQDDVTILEEQIDDPSIEIQKHTMELIVPEVSPTLTLKN